MRGRLRRFSRPSRFIYISRPGSFKGCIQFINAVNSHIDQKKVHLKLRKGKGKNTTESSETTVVDFPTETKEEENAA